MMKKKRKIFWHLTMALKHRQLNKTKKKKNQNNNEQKCYFATKMVTTPASATVASFNQCT